MTNIKPFFSVVIPTYNRADVLSRSVDSVLSQTYHNFELIIIDNGSTDGTQQWVSDNYQDDRIIYHYQKGSGSPASPRNTGISLAHGQWLCLLDSDDMWREGKLKCVYKAIQANADADVICHNENIFFEETGNMGRILKYGPSSKEMYKEMLIFGNRLSTSATSIKVEFLKVNKLQFNESDQYATVEDYDLWLNLADSGARFYFLSQPLGFYTIGKSNMILTSGLYCANLRNLLKRHVFNIQQFKNRSKLWKQVELRLDLCEIKNVKHDLLYKLTAILKLSFRSPINLIIIISGKIKTKFLVKITDK